jgi:hypothetical protein
MLLIGAGFVVAGTLLHLYMWLSNGPADNGSHRESAIVRDHRERRDTIERSDTLSPRNF